MLFLRKYCGFVGDKQTLVSKTHVHYQEFCMLAVCVMSVYYLYTVCMLTWCCLCAVGSRAAVSHCKEIFSFVFVKLTILCTLSIAQRSVLIPK